MQSKVVIPIEREMDIVEAREKGRRIAAAIGFSSTDQTLIATAISEVARNILLYATRGHIVLSDAYEGDRAGIVVVAQDEGPGIRDVNLALQDGYSTSGSLGLGLPGARRLMAELDVDSAPGKGTTVSMRKWVL